MSQSQATDQFHRFVEMWNTGNVEGLEDVFTDDAVYHVPPFPDMGPQALGQFILAFVQTFPDSRVVVDEDIIAGDVSAHRWTWQATYTGESNLLPGPPTGKKARRSGSNVAHWKDGKISEMWHNGDWLGALQDVGLVPPLG